MARRYTLATFDERCDTQGCTSRAVMELRDGEDVIGKHCAKHAKGELRAAEAALLEK